MQLLGFALHAVGDAYAHQGVISKDDYKKVKKIADQNGFKIIAGLKEKILSGSCTTKTASNHLIDVSARNGHKVICDNPHFEEERFSKGAEWGVMSLLAYFQQPDPYLFDPYVFTVDLVLPEYTYEYGIYNLAGNAVACGYRIYDFPKISVSRWIELSGINQHK